MDSQGPNTVITMTPTQKIKWAILHLTAVWSDQQEPEYPCANVDELYDQLVEKGEHWDAKNETRERGIATGLPCPSSRHYECKAVALQMPDKSWVGWTYWHGGGKHGEPEAIEWMEKAYDVECFDEEKLVTVRTFSLHGSGK